LDLNRKHGLAEVGILIGEKEIYGRGVASQAIMRIAGIAREDLGLRRLTAGCYASNQGSSTCLRQGRFTVEGRRPNHFLLDGRPQDLILMGLAL
jgi:RimJ/RimL family protein N-acetyltransferase